MDVKFQLIDHAHPGLKRLKLRQADQDELDIVLPGLPTHRQLKVCVRQSRGAWLIYVKRQLVGVFGITEVRCGTASPWMLGNDLIFKYPLTLMKTSRRIIDGMLNTYHILANFVDARNHRHIRWLKMMGFKFEPRNDRRVGKHLLHYFYKRR